MSRKPSAKQNASIFARALLQLLDKTNFYSRAEWSAYLGVSSPALSQWVNDRTVPRADLLRMVIELLKARGGIGAGEALFAIEAIMEEPAEKISPIGSRFAPNLRSYLSVRSLGDIGRSLRSLPLAEQIALLREGELGASAEYAEERFPEKEAFSAPSPAEGLGPAWRLPRLVRVSGPHGRERQVSVNEFADHRHMIIVGAPGSGKTAFLSYLQAQHPRWRKAEGITLRNHTVDGFAEWIASEERNAPDLPLIVDGLDEMPMGQRVKAVRILDRYSAKARSPRILVASRPVTELEHLSRFDSFSIAPLSDVDLVAEVTRSSLASRNPVEVDRFLCHLTERDSLRAAVRNPLFLQIAWSLFEHSDVTPFDEGAVLREYLRVLLDRDQRHGFSRVREPWATSNNLLSLLGEVSLKLLKQGKERFDEQALAAWLDHSPWDVPVKRLLDLLLVYGLVAKDRQEFSFSHRVLKDYFAARFVVKSAANAFDYFSSPPKQYTFNGAIRLACNLASDASPLLETVMQGTKPWTTNYTLLAEMLAQPIFARPEILGESCRAVVSWLDGQMSDWKLFEEETSSSHSSAKWIVCAQVGKAKEVETVSSALRAIHQARSGPACTPLKAYLREAKSPFLPVFSEAMDVEGRLKINFGAADVRRGAARVAVEALHLA